MAVQLHYPPHAYIPSCPLAPLRPCFGRRVHRAAAGRRHPPRVRVRVRVRACVRGCACVWRRPASYPPDVALLKPGGGLPLGGLKEPDEATKARVKELLAERVSVLAQV